MRIPNVDLAGCDVFLWRADGEIYVLDVKAGSVRKVREGMLSQFITDFPRELSLCILNEQTGQPVRISPLAN